jgi:hypothetical protein
MRAAVRDEVAQFVKSSLHGFNAASERLTSDILTCAGINLNLLGRK